MLRNNIDNSQACLPIKFNADIQVAYLSRLKFNLKNKVRENARILHCDTNAPSHVFLVGSGNRMKQNFIPAFKCLDYPVVISGIYSRTSQHATEVGEVWGIESQAELECPALANADVIVISITTRYVSDILKKIHRFTDTKNKVLIIDTPVFEGLKHIQSAYLLRKYQNTIVTEDYMNFPQFAIIRDIIKQGKLGNIKKIEMHNIGYRYHGLATARAFLEFSLVRSACYQGKTLHYQVNNDCEIVVVEPYQKLDGFLYIKGDKGTLLYCPQEFKNAKEIILQRPADYSLTEQYLENSFVGFDLVGPEGQKLILVPLFERVKSASFFSKEDFNTFKTMGLVEVLNSTFNYNINSQYGFINGLYDNFVSNVVHSRRTFGLPILKIFYFIVKYFSALRN